MTSLDSHGAVIVSFDWQESRSDDSVPYPVSYSKLDLLAITFNLSKLPSWIMRGCGLGDARLFPLDWLFPSSDVLLQILFRL